MKLNPFHKKYRRRLKKYILKKRLSDLSMPAPDILKGFHRHDITTLLEGGDNIGVELGVATGTYSKRMVESEKFKLFIGIDMYSDHHDVNEYKATLLKIGLHSNYRLLRMKFDEALDLFENESLDFIYVDGYAHTGEEGGSTISQWYRKLKIGGLMAGDDYDINAWPLVVSAVNQFTRQSGGKLQITEIVENNDYCQYPSWVLVKPDNREISIQLNVW